VGLLAHRVLKESQVQMVLKEIQDMLVLKGHKELKEP
jgi:hypothetical protein